MPASSPSQLSGWIVDQLQLKVRMVRAAPWVAGRERVREDERTEETKPARQTRGVYGSQQPRGDKTWCRRHSMRAHQQPTADKAPGQSSSALRRFPKGRLSELALNHIQQKVIALQSSGLSTSSKLCHLPLPKTLGLQPQGERQTQSSELSTHDGL